MAVRGGSINSHLRIGRFFSPLIRAGHADFLLSLDPSETANNSHYLKRGGVTVENSTLPDGLGVKAWSGGRPKISDACSLKMWFYLDSQRHWMVFRSPLRRSGSTSARKPEPKCEA